MTNEEENNTDNVKINAIRAGYLKQWFKKTGIQRQDFAKRADVKNSQISYYLNKSDEYLIQHKRIVQTLNEYNEENKFGGYIDYEMVEVPEKSPDNLGSPIYDLDVFAGNADISQDLSHVSVVGYSDVYGMREIDFFFKIRGDSMEPDYRNGGLAGAKRIDQKIIMFGNPYLIFFKGEHPHPPILKYIRKSPNEGKLLLHSLNEKYQDFEIDIDDVSILYAIRGNTNFSV